MTPPASGLAELEIEPEPALELVEDQPPRLVLVPGDEATAGSDFDFEGALAEASARMRRYAVSRLYHDADADEVVQEALLRAVQHRARFASADDLMAWLTVVTGHLVIDRVRARAKATPVAELPSGGRVGRDTADVVVARQEARVALDALEAMPNRQAAVLWAREVEGLDYATIGTRFALTEPTVRSLLHRARKTLRREYAARGGTLPAGGLVALAPWLHPLRALGNLRETTRRFAGPVAAVAVLALAGLLPAVSSGTHAPTPAPALRLPLAAAVQPTQPRTGPGDSTPTATALATAASSSALSATAPDRPAISLPVRLQSVHACSTMNTTRIGINCLQAQPQPRLYIGPALPANPLGIDHLAVEHKTLDCTAIPTTPVTQCSADAGAPTEQPAMLGLLSTRGDSR